MHTLDVTDDELQIIRYSLETWINSFSHDQPDLLHAGKELRAKLERERTTPASTAGGLGQDTWISSN